MRLYSSFDEAFNEIKRDLAELSVEVRLETMQDKYIEGDPDYYTKELTNYMFQVLKPEYLEVPNINVDWVKQEWLDRVAGDLNPGLAWKVREDLWKQFIESQKTANGLVKKFSYTYSERMGGQHIDKIVAELKERPHSRQLFLPVWSRTTDEDRRGDRRVPCSLGYWFVQREGRLHITYLMRSADFITHFPNDVCLATMLLHHVAQQSNLEVGTYTHWIGSLHAYAKDLEGVF